MLGLIFESWKNLFRCMVFIVFVGIVFGSLYYFLRTDLTVKYNKEGTSIFLQHDQKTAHFQLAAASRWHYSGLILKENDEVLVKASGLVNLAFHHLVDAATEDSRPTFPWTGPEGYENKNPRPNDTLRNQFLLFQKANIGALIAYMRKHGESPPSIGVNPRPDGLCYIGKNSTLKNTGKTDVELWFCINEIALDPNNLLESEKAYRNTDFKVDSDAYKNETARWKAIQSNSYWDIWWDDNIGSFDISIEWIED